MGFSRICGGYGSAGVVPGEFTYNTCIASLHTYLGDVDDTHHSSTLLDGGSVLTLPLFCLEGVVLFPGAALPLRVIESNFVAAVERSLSRVDVPYTIGVIRVYSDTATHRMKTASIGTTAQIRQYGRLEDGSLNVVTRGQQRFRLKRCWIDVEGVPYGEIQIIEEDIPSRTPRDVFGKLTPLSNLPCNRATSSVLPSKNSVDGQGSENEESDTEESFENELSSTERRIHQSLIRSSYEYDESASSTDDKLTYESDQEMRSDLNDSVTSTPLLHDHEKDPENLDSIIGSCSSSGKQSSIREGLNWRSKNKDLYSSHRISRAFLPGWVYCMFDSYSLAQRAA
ncbi:protein cereblon, partial [Trifolium pratense]